MQKTPPSAPKSTEPESMRADEDNYATPLLDSERGAAYQKQFPGIVFKSTTKTEACVLSNFFPGSVNGEGLAAAERELGTTRLTLRFAVAEGEEEREYHSSEQAYQDAKYAVIDPSYQDVIRKTTTPLAAKLASSQRAYVQWRVQQRLLRTKRKANKAALKRDFKAGMRRWHTQASVRQMYRILKKKFSKESNPHLHRYLLSGTKARRLGELGRMTRDTWAITGRNLLGRVLETIRDESRMLQEQEKEKNKDEEEDDGR